jgi:NitT/TauT family transport system permease protein
MSWSKRLVRIGVGVAIALPLVLSIVVTEIAVRRGWVQAFLVPTPSNVVRSLYDNWPELWAATKQTLFGAVGGFALAAAIGVAVAIFLSSAEWVRRMFYPYAVFLQTVPIIAIAPLLVIWVGFDIKTVIASAFIVSLFPVIANTLTGLLSTDPALRDLFKLYGAGATGTLLKLRLPFALPNIFTGFRVAAGLSVVGAIVGEFITGGGIGGVIDVARTQQDVNKIFASLLLGSLLGIVLFGSVNLVSYLTLRNWHASERGA